MRSEFRNVSGTQQVTLELPAACAILRREPSADGTGRHILSLHFVNISFAESHTLATLFGEATEKGEPVEFEYTGFNETSAERWQVWKDEPEEEVQFVQSEARSGGILFELTLRVVALSVDPSEDGDRAGDKPNC